MPSDRSLAAVLPDSLVPVAVTIRTAFPGGPFPLVRIVRYAALSLVILGAGFLVGDAAVAVLGVASAFTSPVIGPLWSEFTAVVHGAVDAFTILVALGVFLTQFESDGA